MDTPNKIKGTAARKKSKKFLLVSEWELSFLTKASRGV